MGWMRDNRDALVISVIGGLVVTVGGGVLLSDVLPGSDDGSSQPIVVQAPPAAKPAVITVAVPTPQPQKPAVKAQPPPPPAAAPPPAPPPPVSPLPTPPSAPTVPNVVTTSAGTIVPETSRAKFYEGRLTVMVGKASGGTIGRVGLQAAGKTCAFSRVRPGDVLGVHVTRAGAVGVKVVAVSAKTATLKVATTRVPRRSPACLRNEG